MAFFDDFLFPQISSNRVQVIQNLILTVFNQDSNSFLFDLVHNNLRAVDFFRCVLQSLVEIIRADVPQHK